MGYVKAKTPGYNSPERVAERLAERSRKINLQRFTKPMRRKLFREDLDPTLETLRRRLKQEELKLREKVANQKISDRVGDLRRQIKEAEEKSERKWFDKVRNILWPFSKKK